VRSLSSAIEITVDVPGPAVPGFQNWGAILSINDGGLPLDADGRRMNE